ncbi:MAG: two-component system response regulator [Cardiobacteriales bacterium]|nr:MAG: two-component system response regulator [Cardiobacteriales bacterium]
MTTVLIIDDSPTEAQFVTTMLEQEGYVVDWAIAADKGIKMAKEKKPNVILMDVVMPSMSGFQATRRLHKDPETKNIPIIMLTTKDQLSDKAWAKRNGAIDYLVKPPSKSELIRAIEAALLL